MNNAVLLYGGNLGERFDNLKVAIEMTRDSAGEIIEASSVYESQPWGFETEKYFLNQVVILKTELQAVSLLDILLNIESKLGRKRGGNGYTSRTMDIDILFFNNDIIKSEKLIIPHPRMHKRKFTMMPLAEIIPDFYHPELHKTMKELLNSCEDNSNVNIVRSDRIII